MKEIPLTKGFVALVDDEDFDWLSQYLWQYDNNGYAVRHIKVRKNKWTKIRMHREILNCKKGDKRVVDHINGFKLDNQRNNLRDCTYSQNGANKLRQSNNLIGLKGVSWSKSSNKWFSRICKNKKVTILGYFETPEQAHEAYIKAALIVYDEFANAGYGCIMLKGKNVDA